MRLIFRRSDAMVDRGHPMVDDIELGFPGNVQMTYTTLRECDTDLPIAGIVDGDWYIQPRFIDVGDFGPYSDIIITGD